MLLDLEAFDPSTKPPSFPVRDAEKADIPPPEHNRKAIHIHMVVPSRRKLSQKRYPEKKKITCKVMFPSFVLLIPNPMFAVRSLPKMSTKA